MGSKYRAALLCQPGDIKIEEIEVPHLREQEILVEMKSANLCPTDVRRYKGVKKEYVEALKTGPVILGHEGAGIVAGIGRNVTEFEEGDRVVIYPAISCGKCHYCEGGRPMMCTSLMVADVIQSIDTCRLDFGSTVVVIGLGPMGLLHIQLTRAKGVAKVIGVDLIEERREYAREVGADVVIDSENTDLVKEIMDLTEGRGADAVFIATGGTSEASCISDSLKMIAKSGTVIIFAGTYPSTLAHIDPNLIHYKMVNLTATFGFRPSDFMQAIRFISSKRVKVDAVRKPILRLNDIQEAFETYGSPDVLKIGISII